MPRSHTTHIARSRGSASDYAEISTRRFRDAPAGPDARHADIARHATTAPAHRQAHHAITPDDRPPRSRGTPPPEARASPSPLPDRYAHSPPHRHFPTVTPTFRPLSVLALPRPGAPAAPTFLGTAAKAADGDVNRPLSPLVGLRPPPPLSDYLGGGGGSGRCAASPPPGRGPSASPPPCAEASLRDARRRVAATHRGTQAIAPNHACISAGLGPQTRASARRSGPRPEGAGLRPARAGLRPEGAGLRPAGAGLRPAKAGLPATVIFII